MRSTRRFLPLRRQAVASIQIDEPLFARKRRSTDLGFENLERAFHNCPKDVPHGAHVC